MKKTALSALALAGLAATASAAFADEDQMESQDRDSQNESEMGQESEDSDARQESGPGEMRQGRDGSHMGQRFAPNRPENANGDERAMLNQYLRTDLSDAERASLEAVLKRDREAAKKLAESLKNGDITREEFETQAKAFRAKHIEAVLPYVATDKQDAFKSAVESRPLIPLRQGNVGPMNGRDAAERRDDRRADRQQGDREGRGNGVATVRKAKLLPANIGATIDAKLSKFSTDADKLAWLKGVVTKIETLESKVTARKTKAVLAELKDLLNEKIDSLNGTASDADVINELLN